MELRGVESEREPARPMDPVRLVGEPTELPTVLGTSSRYVNFDYAATTPCLVEVEQSVRELLEVYASVHRGAGVKAALSNLRFDEARARVAAFFGATDDDVVVFTSGTTDALNLLAATIAPRRVLVHDVEHHANLLPWRRHGHEVRVVPTPTSPEAVARGLHECLLDDPVDLVAVTGASNVTGEVWPVAELAEVAHRHGARVVLDAAQLAPHKRVSIAESGVDWLAFSGHKLYAPFGAGALVGRSDWLEEGRPYRVGGGAVDYVSTDEVLWSALPARLEAGSPNLVGIVALGAALSTLLALDLDAHFSREAALMEDARARLETIDGVRVLRWWPREAERVGVVTFVVDGVDHGLAAAVLGAEWNVGVRSGRFCAHPFAARLLGVGADELERVRAGRADGSLVELPGALRASGGLGTTPEDVDRLVEAVGEIARRRWRWSYRLDEGSGAWVPDPETRPLSVAGVPSPESLAG